MKGLWIKTGLLILACAGAAYSQVTMDFLGGGVRAQGMGKAFYAVSDDISALTWNPAGLAKQEKPVLGFSYGLFDPRGTFNMITQSGAISPRSQNGSFDNASFVGFLAPVRVRGHQFVLSATYNRAFDEYQSASDSISGLFPNYYQNILIQNAQATYTVNTDYKGSPYVFSLGFGTRLYHSWDFGAAVNVYTGNSVSHRLTNINSSQWVSVRLLGQTVQYDSISRATDTVRFGGVNFTLATKYSSPRFDFGLVIKSGYSLLENLNTLTENIVTVNGLVQGTSSDSIYNDNLLVKVQVPWVVGAGFAYKIQPNWLGSLDMEYRPWSGKKLLVRDSIVILSGGDTREVFTTQDGKWFNAFTVRAGTEYVWNTKSKIFPSVPLRAGVGYVPLPAPSYPTADTSNTQSVTMYTLNVGTGVYWAQIHLDVAYTYSTFNFDTGIGELKSRNHNLGMMFTGYF